MGYDNDSPAFVKFRKIFNYSSFVLSIEGICRFIKENEVWILIDSTGYENTLFLPLTETNSVTTNQCIIFKRKSHYIVMYVGYECRFFKTTDVNIAIVNRNVTGNGFRKYHSVLHDDTAMPTPPFQIVFIDVSARN